MEATIPTPKEKRRTNKKARKKLVRQHERYVTDGVFSIDPGSFNPEEYAPLLTTIADAADLVELWESRLNPMLLIIQEKLLYRMRRVVNHMYAKKKVVTQEFFNKLIDTVSARYEVVERFGDVTVRILPMMQLYMRSPTVIEPIYSHERYSNLSKEERCSFISGVACELLGATLLKVWPETDLLPTLVAVADSGKANLALSKIQPVYHYNGDELNAELLAIANLVN